MDSLRNNYLKYNIERDRLHVSVDRPALPLGTFYEETIKQLKYVYDNKTKPVYAFLSGGLDSEFLLHVMSEMKLDFTTVILRKLGENKKTVYNAHDISNAFNICEKLNIKPLVYDFDIDEYVNGPDLIEDYPILKEAYSKHIDGAVWMRVAKAMNGCTLIGGEFHGVRKDTNRDQWNFRVPRNSMVYMKLFDENNLEGSPFFMSYSSEMLFSFLLDPEIVKLCSNGYPGKIAHESLKAIVYNRGNNFNLKPYDYVTKERIKITGWEKIIISPIPNHPLYLDLRDPYENSNLKPVPISEYKEDYHSFLHNHNIKA
jgi:hypothetical protein